MRGQTKPGQWNDDTLFTRRFVRVSRIVGSVVVTAGDYATREFSTKIYDVSEDLTAPLNDDDVTLCAYDFLFKFRVIVP